jgi:hypothetical protein
MTDMRKLFLAIAITLALPCTPAFAQPDLSGYWMISFGATPPNRAASPFEQEAIDQLPSGTKLLADSGLVEFPPGEYGGLELTEATVAKIAAYDMDVQVSIANTCQPPSIIYSMQGPFPMEIFQGRDLIVIKMEYYDVVRIVFMNETTHPTDWPHSVAGHSIGRWEGDTLVVDTAFIQSSTMMNNGLDHSDDLKLIERFRLSPDGKTILLTQEFEDPAVFAGRAARLIPLDKGEGHVYPYACDPSYGAAIEGREGQ